MLSQPVITLNVLGNAAAEERVSPRRTLTLYLAANDRVFVLDRIAPTHAKAAVALTEQTLGKSLNNLLISAQQQLKPDTLFCVIKPLPSASYAQIIKALDLLAARKIRKYALIADPTPAEQTLLAAKGERIEE